MENNILSKAGRMLYYADSLQKVANFNSGFAFYEADRLFKQGINITAKSPEPIWGKECFTCNICDPYTKTQYSDTGIQNHIQSPAHKEMYDKLIVIPESAGLECVFAEYNCKETLAKIHTAKLKAEKRQEKEKTILGIIS
jgi:hypothetical protein